MHSGETDRLLHNVIIPVTPGPRVAPNVMVGTIAGGLAPVARSDAGLVVMVVMVMVFTILMTTVITRRLKVAARES